MARPRSRWKDYIKMNIEDVRMEGVNCAGMVKIVQQCETCHEPLGFIKFEELFERLSSDRHQCR
jgi:hypothetical protein